MDKLSRPHAVNVQTALMERIHVNQRFFVIKHGRDFTHQETKMGLKWQTFMMRSLISTIRS